VVYDDDIAFGWPEDADGGGRSLQRISTDLFGSSPASWIALDPTPGVVDIIEVLFGDYTQNNELDKDDIDILNDAIRMGSQDTIYDINGDGSVNGEDRDAWIIMAGTNPGDADLDGVVDTADYEEWLKNLGDDVGERWRDGDFTGDEAVDETDFAIWSANRFAVGIRHEPFHPSTRTPRAPISLVPIGSVTLESAIGGNDRPAEGVTRSDHRQSNQLRRSSMGMGMREPWLSRPQAIPPIVTFELSGQRRDRSPGAKLRSALTGAEAAITIVFQPSELTDRALAEWASRSMGS
jgi:hypothetical protein